MFQARVGLRTATARSTASPTTATYFSSTTAKTFRAEIGSFLTDALKSEGIYGASFFREPTYAQLMFQERFRNEGGKFFDAQSMKATVNNATGVRVLTEMRKENRFMPPGVEKFGFAAPVRGGAGVHQRRVTRSNHMLALVVEFRIDPAQAAAFDAEITANARASRETEPGCRQFDVCRDPADPGLFFLYELYDDEAAIQAHLRTPHYLRMEAATASWVQSKIVRRYVRAAG